MALPMTLIIITSGIDLSVGSNMALSAVVMGAVYGATHNFGFALLCCLATGTLAGALNGILIAKTRIAPLVMTLATMSLYLGIPKIISGTKIFSDFPDGFTFLQTNKLFGVVPYQFVLFIALFIILGMLGVDMGPEVGTYGLITALVVAILGWGIRNGRRRRHQG